MQIGQKSPTTAAVSGRERQSKIALQGFLHHSFEVHVLCMRLRALGFRLRTYRVEGYAVLGGSWPATSKATSLLASSRGP